MAKGSKRRADNDKPLKIYGSFEDVIGVSINSDKSIMKQKTTQERYEDLYKKVEVDLINSGIAKSLPDVCSVKLDARKAEQVTVVMLGSLELETVRAVKRSFDKHSPELGLTVTYPNLSGSIFNS